MWRDVLLYRAIKPTVDSHVSQNACILIIKCWIYENAYFLEVGMVTPEFNECRLGFTSYWLRKYIHNIYFSDKNLIAKFNHSLAFPRLQAEHIWAKRFVAPPFSRIRNDNLN